MYASLSGVLQLNCVNLSVYNFYIGARARVALTGLAIAEYFRDQEGQDVLLFVDNIFRWVLKYFLWWSAGFRRIVGVVYSDDSSHDLINYYFFNCFRFTQAGSEVSALLGNKSTRTSSSSTFFNHHHLLYSIFLHAFSHLYLYSYSLATLMMMMIIYCFHP